MTAQLAPYQFGGHEVRVVVGADGEPWFVAGGVCAVLDLPNVSQAVSRLAEDEKSTITSGEGGPGRLIVNEAGLYRLIFTSRRPEAEAFRRWVTHEVLPTIRRTGSYGTAPAVPEIGPAFLRQIAEAMEAKDQQIAELEPRAAVADTLMTADGDYSLREAAQILSRDHGIDTGQNRLLRTLRDLGWVDYRGKPYQRSIENGRLSVRTRTYDHPHTGEPTITTQVRVTGKGLAWLHGNWPQPRQPLAVLPGGMA
ncbi:phage antirepressor KilAC domain-containing protein [Blastococcus sp. SYSU D00813]